MTTATTADEGIWESDFVKEMVKQMRALDSYGTYDGWPNERVLAPYIVTKDQRREIPVIGDPDEVLLARVKAFYNGLAVLVEKECGLMATSVINITHEGFGRALIIVGKLVVVDRTLRDVHRFGFDSISKMKDEADKILSVATTIIGKYGEVAGL
ncbi:NifX-associated nitrogen fixation protein [Zoogloea sp.]|uniref:NifX-associated nitrogen fixation protein n=1 Tax=Zoogloea sp. TaxID=49181 RepID=UPI0035B0B2FB|nr:NifX-associated nitrogen fixation protein [Rhodocyclales bacterium]